jgi:rfaE bifunctional protein kinase chain/domain
MNKDRLLSILDQFKNHRIVLCGDFFLDHYVHLDPALNEISIETGKTAYQVVGHRPQPGAAGTVCNNLVALGVRHLSALTVIGDDGNGYELKQELTKRQVNIDNVIESQDRFTPTYMKPMLRLESGEVELERFDTKNLHPLASSLEDELCIRLETMCSNTDVVILADQVQERNCGVVTDSVRDTVAQLALRFPQVLFFADSRERIGEFHNVTMKPNRHETVKAVGEKDCDTSTAIACAQTLHHQTKKPVFLTLDKEGICPIDGHEKTVIPCPRVQEPIDIVGAGDSTTAGIVCALASGASVREAAILGNLVASITIRQLGTTGTATPQQVVAAWEQNRGLYDVEG